MNRIKLTILFIFFCVLNYSQTIELVKFDNSKTYTPGSGVSMHINPTGVFVLDNPSNLSANTNNSFILELSSPGGDFTNSTNLGIVNDFYTPLMNGLIPDGTAAGEYKLRIRSTNPVTSVESDSFSIVDFTVSSLPSAISNIAVNTNYFECLNDGDNIINPSFGSLKQAFDATVAEMPSAYKFLQIAPSNTSNSINVNIIDILSGTTALMTPISPGVYVIPDNLEVGTYNLEVEELDVSGNSSFFSFTFLFHTSATTFGTPGIDIVCTNTEVEFNVDISMLGIGRNYMGSYYTFNWGDGSAVDVLTHAELIEAYTAPLDLISHTFILPSCTVGGGSSFDVKMDLYNKGLAVNGTDPSCEEYVENGTGSSKEIITSDAPQANFTLAEEQCITENIIATNTTINGSYPVPDGSCSGEPTFTWFYKPPSASDFIPVFDSSPWLVGNDLIIPAEDITTPGCWTIKLSAVNPDFCQIEDIHEDTINIEDIPDADFDIMNFGSVTQDLNIEPGNTVGTGFYTSGNSYTAGQTGKLINVSMRKNAICDSWGGFSPTLQIYQGQVAYNSWGVIGNPPLLYQKSFPNSYWNSSNSVYGSYGIQSGWFTMEIPIDEAPTLNAGTQYSIIMTGSGCNQFLANNDPANTDVNFIASGATQSALDNYVLVMKTTMLLDPASDQNTEVSQICANEIVELLDASNIVSAECDNSLPDEDPTYQWTISPNSGYTLFNSTTLTSQSPQVQFNSVGNYTITQTVTTECGSDSFSSDLEVIGNPSVSFAQGSQTYCLTSGSNLLIDFANELTPTYSTGLNAPNSYTWTVSGDGIDTDDYSFESSTTDSDAFPTIQLNSYGTYNITVTANSNCDTPASDTIVIALSETPIITNNSNSQLVCSANASLQFDFTSSISNTTYSWVVNENENLTGFFQSGTTSFIPSQTITNLTNTDQDLVYEITPISEGCVGTPFEYTFNVLPIPIITDRDETICDGETFNIQPTQNNTDENNLNEIIPIGTLYEWSEPVSNPPGAITGGFSVNEGVESISQTLTNLTDNPATLTYTVTPHYFDCIGDSFEVVVTVNPTVGVNAIADQVLCNGDDTIVVNFSTSVDPENISGFTYLGELNGSYYYVSNETDSWVDAKEIGENQGGHLTTITSAEENNFVANALNTTLQNPDQAVWIGLVQNLTSPDYSEPAGAWEWVTDENISYENWSNLEPSNLDNPNIPIENHGEIYPPNSTWNDNIGESGGAERLFVIEISQSSNVTDEISYIWTNDNTDIGLAASGIGNIPSFTATNDTTNQISGNITVTALYTYNGVSCQGESQSFTITVNPSPQVDFSENNQTIVSGETTNDVNLTSPTDDVVFSWTASVPSGISGITTTSGTDYIPEATLINTTNQPLTVAYTAIATGDVGFDCEGLPTFYFITVNPLAMINPVNDQIICNGDNILVEFSSDLSGGNLTYSWTNDNSNIGLSNTGTGNIDVIATNTTNAPISSTIVVTPSFENGGNTNVGDPITFEITVNPTGQVNFIGNQIVSNGFETLFVEFSTININGTTTYDWLNDLTSIGLAASGTGNIPAFSSVNSGTSPITAMVNVTPTFENGGVNCEGPAIPFEITVNPTAQVNPTNDFIVSNGDNINIPFTTINSGGTTTYNWSNSDSTIGLTATGFGDIDFTVVNNGTAPVTATVVVTPTFENGGNSNSGPIETFTITINPTAQIDPIDSLVFCNEDVINPIEFNTQNIGGTTTYTWTNDNTSIGLAASGTGTISEFTVLNSLDVAQTANIVVTPTFDNGGVSNTGSSESFTITVNPTAQVELISDLVYCNEDISDEIVFDTINSDGVSSYSWTNDNTDIGLAAGGNGNIPSFTTLNTSSASVVSNITVTPSYTNNGVTCDGPSEIFTITVNPTAQVEEISNQILCNGETTEIISFDTINTDGVSSYSWTNDNTDIGLASSGNGDILAFTVSNPFNNVIVSNITVTPTYTNNGISCSGPSKSFTISVNPTAQVDTVIDQVLCNGETTESIVFTTINSGGDTVYNWTNDNTSIGLPISGGTGDIGSFVVTNDTSESQTATFVVTPVFTSEGVSCEGPTETFTIIINPTAQVNTIDDQDLCEGEFTNPIEFTTINNDGTTTFEWTNTNPLIGLAESGVGNIPSFEVLNNVANSQNAIITVTPTYTNNGVECTGPSKEFILTVNPTAQVNSIQSQVFCNGDISNEIIFNTSNTDGITTYDWTNDNSSIGLSETGTGSIPSFELINVSNISQVATISVIPTYDNNGVLCTGAAEQFTITVNPSAQVNDTTNYNTILCDGEFTPVFSFSTSNNDGLSTFNWTNDNVEIGLADSGVGGIPSFQVSNPNQSSITATITVTPIYENNGIICDGDSETFTIVVNPSPVMDNVDDIVLCNNENSSLIEFTTINTDGITSYSWTNNNTTIGLTSNGNGDIPSFTAINNGVITETATITVTPTYDNNGIICVGSSQTFSISVLSDIEITGTSIDALDCADPNSGNINITVGGGSGDYSFVWSNGATTEDLNNIGPGEYSVTVTDSESCSAISETFNIFRQEDLTVQLDSQIIPFCENNLVTQENRITITGGLGPYTVNWSAGSVSIDDNTFMTAYQNGLYTVLVTDQYGCQVSTDILVDFEELGEPSFDYDSSGNIDCGISIYNELTFINTSSGDYTNVIWDFGDGSSVSSGDTATHQYLNSGSYTVTQTVEYNYGCIEVYYEDIEISDGYDIVLPSAFSPNGDGINDTMRPVYTCVNNIEMSIYDTFGSLIYYENNLDLIGWDGTLKGKLAENGNYLITVKGTTIYNEEINLNGVFVLLR